METTDLKNCIDPNSQFAAQWYQICNDSDNKKRAFIETLRAAGFKAAHPNDGWVDRQNNTIILCYPRFNDGLGVGDSMMIGSHYDSPEELRPVKIVAIDNTMFGTVRYSFEDL